MPPRARTSTAKATKVHAQGGLYPTVAVSDAFNAAGCFAAAAIAHEGAPALPAWIGFLIVAIAATVGMVRFGFAESLLARTNADLAGLAAILGLPIVGLSFALKWGVVSADGGQQLAFVACCAVVYACSASLPEGAQELLKVVWNLFLFIGPVAGYGAARGDRALLASVGLFAVAGTVVGGSKDKSMLGMLNVNLFHYMIGLANYGIARGLVA